MARPLNELIAPDWAEALADVEPQIHTMGDFLRQEIAEGRSYLPAGDNVLRAFSRPLAGVRVLIVGQDPYPTPGHAVGFEQGVLLLNRVLTGSPGKAGSHRGKGWEAVTTAAISALAERGGPLVAILWGRDAQSTRSLLGQTPIIASAHPSPLSARNGFFGSRPFSRANEALIQQGASPVNWDLNTPAG